MRECEQVAVDGTLDFLDDFAIWISEHGDDLVLSNCIAGMTSELDNAAFVGCDFKPGQLSRKHDCIVLRFRLPVNHSQVLQDIQNSSHTDAH